MTTQEQHNPFQEEHNEEKERLYGRDKKSRNSVDMENVPDNGPLPDQFQEKEAVNDEEPDDTFEMAEYAEDKQSREEKIEELKKAIKKGNAGFFAKQELAELQKEPDQVPLSFRQGNGVASIGPDILEEEKSKIAGPVVTEIDLKENIIDDNKKSHQGISPVTGEPNYDMRRNEYRYMFRRKEENLKTELPRKTQRRFRDVLRGLFHNSKKGDPHEEKADIVGDFEFQDENEKYDLRDSAAKISPSQNMHRDYEDKENAA